jgi:hypothetical protein
VHLWDSGSHEFTHRPHGDGWELQRATFFQVIRDQVLGDQNELLIDLGLCVTVTTIPAQIRDAAHEDSILVTPADEL